MMPNVSKIPSSVKLANACFKGGSSHPLPSRLAKYDTIILNDEFILKDMPLLVVGVPTVPLHPYHLEGDAL